MPQITCPCLECTANVGGQCIAEHIELRWVEIITAEGLESKILDCFSKE